MPPKKKATAKAKPAKASKKTSQVEEDEEEDEEEEEEEEPKAKAKPKAKGKGKTKGGVDWQAMLDSLEAGGANGNILFPKSGKTRIKLVLEDEDNEESWYQEVQGEFEGRKRSRYILRAVVLFPAQEEQKIMGVVVAKTAMKQIVGLLAEGYDLFDSEDGHGLTISKTGAQLNTSWGVTPSPKPVEIDLDDYTDDGAGLEELEKALASISSSSGTKKKKGKSESDEDEDEDEEEDW